MLGGRRGATTGQLSRNDEARPRPRFARKAERFYIDAEVFLRRSGKLNIRVRGFDVSRFGCKIEFVERPSLDERVWIKFDGLGSLEGLVCWVDGFVAGIEFTQAIHPAVFESLMPRLR